MGDDCKEVCKYIIIYIAMMGHLSVSSSCFPFGLPDPVGMVNSLSLSSVYAFSCIILCR